MKLRRLLLGRKVMTNLAAVAAKSLQLCLTLCDPIDGSPPGSAVPGILQARTLEWVAIAFSDQPRHHIKKHRQYFANKGPSSQSYGFSSGHVWMWELDYKESWVPKNWCFWTVVLKKTLENPLHCEEIKSVNPKGKQSWIFTGQTDAEAEAPVLWAPDAKSWLIGKDPDAGKDWRQVEKGTTEDEKVGWHHQLNGHEFEKTLGVGEGQEAWRAAVHGVTKSQTLLSDWTELKVPVIFRNI